jgi:hypothetical protein
MKYKVQLSNTLILKREIKKKKLKAIKKIHELAMTPYAPPEGCRCPLLVGA